MSRIWLVVCSIRPQKIDACCAINSAAKATPRMMPRYLPRLPVSILSAIQFIACALRARWHRLPLRVRIDRRQRKSRHVLGQLVDVVARVLVAVDQIANDRIGNVIEQALADDAERREMQLFVASRRGNSSRRIACRISNCGRMFDWAISAQAAVGCMISRITSRVRQVSSGPPSTRRKNVWMKSASFLRGGVFASQSGSCGLIEPPTMGPHHRLDVEPLLVAEVIVHRRDVRPGRLTDVADRRGLEATLGKQLARPPRRCGPGLYLSRFLPYLPPYTIVSNICFNQLYHTTRRVQGGFSVISPFGSGGPISKTRNVRCRSGSVDADEVQPGRAAD